MRLFSILGAALFLLAAAVQYNDPDPQIWIPVYVIAALICLLVISGRVHWIIPVLASGLAFAGFALMAIRVFGAQPLFSETAREMWGLLVIAIWLDALGVLLILKGRSAG